MVDCFNGCFTVHQQSKDITTNQQFYISFHCLLFASYYTQAYVLSRTHRQLLPHDTTCWTQNEITSPHLVTINNWWAELVKWEGSLISKAYKSSAMQNFVNSIFKTIQIYHMQQCLHLNYSSQPTILCANAYFLQFKLHPVLRNYVSSCIQLR
jgi:hypothetical protein